MRPFTPNPHPTVGVEEEFHLIDPKTAELAPCVDDVMAALDEPLRRRVCHELFTCVIESNSRPARTVDELVVDVAEMRRRLASACASAGVLLVAAGTHPFSDWRKQVFVDSDHYRWVRDGFGTAARHMLAFGLHIHVGLGGADEALYVMHEMRRWVYPLMAMGANSPYIAGQDAGLVSARTHVFNAMPRTELPPEFADFAELEDLYGKLLGTGDITHPGDLWWCIRPQPVFGTLEIRTLDLPTDVARLGALVAVYQAAAAVYQDRFRAGAPRSTFRSEYLNQNRWRAMRDGLRASIIEPQTGQIVAMVDHVSRLLDLAEGKADELSSERYLRLARQMLTVGTEADVQRGLVEQFGGNLRELELALARRTVPAATFAAEGAVLDSATA